MKKIHKNVIALKAKAVTKGLKAVNFKKSKMKFNNFSNLGDFLKTVSVNNTVFAPSSQMLLGMKDSKKAKFLDIFLNSEWNNHYRHRSHWAFWHHAFCFSSKIIMTEFVHGIEMSHTFDSVADVSEWLKNGRPIGEDFAN